MFDLVIIIIFIFVIYKKSNKDAVKKKVKRDKIKVLIDNNDWLSQQLEEERKSYAKLKSTFGCERINLHKNNCDADLLASEHRSVCDASGVDNGISK